MLYSNAFFLAQCIFTPCRLGQVVTKQKKSIKNKHIISESYSDKTFSIRKQLFYMLETELDFTESEVQ